MRARPLSGAVTRLEARTAFDAVTRIFQFGLEFGTGTGIRAHFLSDSGPCSEQSGVMLRQGLTISFEPLWRAMRPLGCRVTGCRCGFTPHSVLYLQLRITRRPQNHALFFHVLAIAVKSRPSRASCERSTCGLNEQGCSLNQDTDLRKVGPRNSQELRRNGAGTGALYKLVALWSGRAARQRPVLRAEGDRVWRVQREAARRYNF